MKLGVIADIDEYFKNNPKPKPKQFFRFMVYLRDKYYPYLTVAELTKKIFDKSQPGKYQKYTREELKKKRKELIERYNKGETHLINEIEEIDKLLFNFQCINEILLNLLILFSSYKLKVNVEDIKQLNVEDIDYIISKLQEVYKNGIEDY
jgi:hypothetical protein